MAERGRITIDALLAPIKDVLNRRQFPKKAMSEMQVDMMIRLLSSMDTDKDPDAARVGEREGRVASPLLGRLSGGFNHGIGRSGHVTAPQPKAPGASLMQQLANHVSFDAIRSLGMSNIKDGIVTPLATGMTIALVLAAMRRELGIDEVLYPRIDHISPKRGIAFAGVAEISVPTILEGDAVHADMSELEKLARKKSSSAVLATTTFFPPREPDPVKDIAKLCAEHNLPLIINNAYGVQSEEIMNRIRSAIDAGRVDAVIQSTDKNFLTPVGGSIIASPNNEVIRWVAETYAGRASASPILHTLAALLLIGKDRYLKLRSKQEENKKYLENQLRNIADKINQRILSVWNPVAYAMTMEGLNVKDIGAKLYNRRVTGPRAMEKGAWGSSIDDYPHSYLVMNAAIGSTRNDIEKATAKLYKELSN